PKLALDAYRKCVQGADAAFQRDPGARQRMLPRPAPEITGSALADHCKTKAASTQALLDRILQAAQANMKQVFDKAQKNYSAGLKRLDEAHVLMASKAKFAALGATNAFDGAKKELDTFAFSLRQELWKTPELGAFVIDGRTVSVIIAETERKEKEIEAE